ncbi:heavy metal translocating P-type ATPase metal-binding domain-containing protein [Methylomonas koyamae]
MQPNARLMVQNKQVCDLCELEVRVIRVELNTQEGKKIFCCEGCKAIYKMQYDAGLLVVREQIGNTKNHHRKK